MFRLPAFLHRKVRIPGVLKKIIRREEVEAKYVAAFAAGVLAASALGIGVGVHLTSSLNYPDAFSSYSTGQILDCSWSCPSGAQAKAAGYRGIMSYLSRDTSGKNWTASRLTSVRSAGIAAGMNFEDSAYDAAYGYSQGVADAKVAVSEEQALSVPSNTPTYFSVDFDSTPQQQCAIDDYFRGVDSVIPAANVGAYGGFWPLSRPNGTASCVSLAHSGYVNYLWQTLAWSGGNASPARVLYQNGGQAFNGNADTDVVSGNWGGWLPDGSVLSKNYTPPAPGPAPAPAPPPPPPSCTFGNSGWSARPWYNGDGNQAFTVYKYGGAVDCLNPEFSYGIQVWTGSYWANVCSPSLGTCWDGWTTRTSDYWDLSYYDTPCNHLFRAMIAIRSGNGKVAGYRQVGSWKITSDCS